MKNISSSLLITGLFFLVNNFTVAQCPVVTCPSTLSLPCSTNGIGQNVTAIANYSANITSEWFASGYVPLSSSGTATSLVNINCPGVYSVQFKDNLSGCVVTETLLATGVPGVPVFSLTSTASANGFMINCSNTPIDINIIAANTVPPGGATSYALGALENQPANPGPFSQNNGTNVSTCGNYFAMVKDNGSLCISSFSIYVKCVGVPTLSVRHTNDTICVGIPAVLTASGASTYLWNTGETTSAISVTPAVPTTYYVTGYNGPGCSAVYSVAAIMCAASPVTPTSPTTGFADVAEPESVFLLYPNPATDILKVHASSNTWVNYSIHDVLGKEVARSSFKTEKSIDISVLQQGVYLFSFECGNEIFFRKVLVKN